MRKTIRKSLEQVKKDKQGNLLDIVMLPVILFATAVVLFFIYYVYVQIQTPLSDNLDDSLPSAPQFLTNLKEGLKIFDAMFPIFLIGLILTSVISAYLIDSYPFLFFVSTFLMVIAILLAAILANVHGEMIRTNPEFVSVVGDWETTNWIINHLPIIVCVAGFAIAIALFTKVPGGGKI